MIKRSVLSIAAVVALSIFGCDATGDPNEFENSGGSGDGGGGTDGTGDTPHTGDGAKDDHSDGACAEDTFEGVMEPGSLLMVVDVSGSMQSDTMDKWTPTKSALQSTLNSTPDPLRVGLSFFPAGTSSGDPFCEVTCIQDPYNAICQDPSCGGCNDVMAQPGVPVGPLSQTRQQIQNALGSKSTGGNTPTFRALEAAYANMKALDADGPRFVLLLTDGDPTVAQASPFVPAGPKIFGYCGESQDIAQATANAKDNFPEVKTFVVGSPGVDNQGFMSHLAVLGGTPQAGCVDGAGCENSGTCCHYTIGTGNFEQDLANVLKEIAGQIATCTFAIPGGDEADPNKVNVTIEAGGVETELDQTGSNGNGWDYTDGNKTSVTLYGTACEQVKADPNAKVTIFVGCPTRIPT